MQTQGIRLLVTPIYGNGGDEVMNEDGYVVGLPPWCGQIAQMMAWKNLCVCP